jgi:hypothetical protein
MSSSSITRKPVWKRSLWVAGLLVLVGLLLVACQQEQPAPTAVPPAAEEPAATDTPVVAEEPEVEEEAAPTDTPAAEEEPAATDTPAAEEEPEATGTPAAEEEPEATGTPAPEEEADEADASAMPDDVAAGEYIAVLTGGCGCHFNRDEGALAGGNRFEGPFGVAFAANITPDEETGIGSWSAEEIADALRLGVRPDGTQLHPIMPYRAFSVLSDQEALNVAAYLLSQDPVANEVPERELTTEPAAFTPAADPPAEPVTDPVARGQVLATIARCGGCHTPLNDDGTPNMDLFLAGALVPNTDEFAPNITSDEDTGIGLWTEEELAHFLQTGMYPDGSLATGAMAQQIERRFSQLTDNDALAIGAFLKSVPPISNSQ